MIYKITILTSTDKRLEGMAHLRCRVRWDGLVWAMNVGYKVVTSKWSHESQRAKANTTHDGYTAATINRAIERLIRDIECCFEHFDLIDTIPTLEEMKAYYGKTYGKTTEESAPERVTQMLDRFVKEASSERAWSIDSVKKFGTMRNHIIAYNDCQLAKIDERWLNGFVVFMSEDLNLINSTIDKYVGCIRWMMRWADERGLVPPDWRTWHPRLKTAQNKVIFLTWEELMTVYEHPLEWDYQRRVRDLFCFCCFSGLRYSDAQNLKKSDVLDDMISFTAIKDHEQLNVNLNKYSKAILAKYKGNDGEKALPTISNQKYNKYIKEVMKMCEINSLVSTVTYKGSERIETTQEKWQVITTHTARKTFVCNALSLGIAPEVVMRWTGHSDYRAMKPYIDVADSVKRDAMSKFDEK